jgi:hypothetical protein
MVILQWTNTSSYHPYPARDGNPKDPLVEEPHVGRRFRKIIFLRVSRERALFVNEGRDVDLVFGPAWMVIWYEITSLPDYRK